MKTDWKTCARVGVSAFVLYLGIHYWDVFTAFARAFASAARPLFLGCIFAYILNIPMSFYERRLFRKTGGCAGGGAALAEKCRRPVCMLLAFLSVGLAAALILLIVLPELGNCFALMLSRVPSALSRIADSVADLPWLPEDSSAALSGIDWQQLVPRVMRTLADGLGSAGDLAVNLISSMVSVAANLLIALIFSIYLLSGKERLGRQFIMLAGHYLPEGMFYGGLYVLKVADDCFRRYVAGQCTEAVILGALCAAGMLLFRFPYATVVGVTVGFTALIPVAGAYIGGAVGFLLILTDSPARALLFLVYLTVLQQLEGNIIYPRVVGTSLGLPGIWVLAAVIVGGGFGGLAGMLLGVPLTACAYRLVKEDVACSGSGRPVNSIHRS